MAHLRCGEVGQLLLPQPGRSTSWQFISVGAACRKLAQDLGGIRVILKEKRLDADRPPLLADCFSDVRELSTRQPQPLTRQQSNDGATVRIQLLTASV